jgi:hypothetical protein
MDMSNAPKKLLTMSKRIIGRKNIGTADNRPEQASLALEIRMSPGKVHEAQLDLGMDPAVRNRHQSKPNTPGL